MARPSRPPGFDMTYRPEKRMSFGPPLREQLPTYLYFTFAITSSATRVATPVTCGLGRIKT